MSKRPSKTEGHAPVTESDGDDAFLSRWARRKRVARTGGDPDAERSLSSVPGPVHARTPPEAPGTPPEDEARELTDADMPPVESIDENTDMSGFFSSKVSQHVKRAALRKFFHSPAFNVVDGLDDYDDDFRSFAALGDIITSDMRSQMEREAEQARQRLAGDAEAADSTAQAPPQEAGALEEAAASSDDQEAVSEPPPATASGEPGVTRDPAGAAGVAGAGKLRRRGAAGDDA